MTRVDLPVVPSSPTGGNGSRRPQPSGVFEEADAGFLQQLASMMADEDASSCVPLSRDAGEAVIARWWQRQADPEPSQTHGPEQRVERIPEFAGLPVVDAAVAEVAPLVGPDVVPRPGEGPEPQTGDEPQPQPRDPAPRLGDNLAMEAGAAPAPAVAGAASVPAVASVPAAAPRTTAATGIDARRPRAAPAEPLPLSARDAPAEAAEAAPRRVHVVRAETHLPPVRLVAPMPPASRPAPAPAERAGAADSRKPDQPVDGVRTVRPGPMVPLGPTVPRGQSPEHALRQVATDQPDADTAQPNSDGESAPTPAAPLPTRGLVHATPSAASPAQQIAEKIATELTSGATDTQRAAPAAVPRPAPLQPVKVLTIQLHPADLGTVTVRLTLKADVMDVQVEVSRPTTARLIDSDRETLTSLLRSAGYQVEGLTVRAVEPASPASPSDPSQGSPDSGPQLQPGGSQTDARPSGGRAQPGPHGHTQGVDRNTDDGKQAPGDRRGAGLYV